MAARGPLAPLLSAVASVYYFLPGPYEWERERDKDLLATMILPPLGLAGWSLASGRLAVLTGHGPYVGVSAWGLLVALALPLWPSLPRLVLAGAPTALLLSGVAESLLRLAGVPLVFAWIGAGVFGVVVSARLYLFAVLPTLLACWMLANASVGLTALGSAVGGFGAAFTTVQLGVLTLAALLGVLTWVTVVSWDRPVTLAGAGAAPAAAVEPAPGPLFRRVSADRVQAIQTVPLRTDRNRGEPPTAVVMAQQEANVLLVIAPWAFVQTDDGNEGWAEWSVVAS